MELSVVIVSYNAGTILRDCIASVLADLRGGELANRASVTVVDNHSSDPAVRDCRAQFSGINWIQFSRNQGFSAAVNAGVAQSVGELVFILNPDCEVSKGFFSDAIRSFRTHGGCAAMGFRQVDEKGALQLSVGGHPGYINELFRKWTQSQFDKGRGFLLRFMTWYLRKPREVSWVAASALLVRRSDFERIAGFDESFFLYFEDIDFCLRLREEVGPVFFEPRVTLTHLRGVSMSTNPMVAESHYRESQLRFWRKYKGARHEAIIRLYLRLTKRLPE